MHAKLETVRTTLRRGGWLLAGLLACGGLPALAADPDPAPDAVARAGDALARALDQEWPDHPEWLAMFADILRGSQLGPGDGWFRKATARTRFGWEAVRMRYDTDGDGNVERGEFPGSDTDFLRLDRDHDGVLGPADFDWSAHALTPTPGAMLYLMADRDGNGKVTRAEFAGLFDRLDADRAGFLSQEELRSLLTPPAPRPSPPPGVSAAAPASGPSRGTLIRGLFRQEIGALGPGPGLDEHAPDFTLSTVDGDRQYTLSKLIGPKPVVLVFGNFTCGPFRSRAGDVEKLYLRYRDRATFLMIYVREAHPTDGWHMTSNDRYGVSLPQPATFEQRTEVARTCRRVLDFDMPFLVDTLDDRVGSAYSGMPSRLYLIDRAGKVAYKSGRGPFGFKPGELEQSLILLLDENAPGNAE